MHRCRWCVGCGWRAALQPFRPRTTFDHPQSTDINEAARRAVMVRVVCARACGVCGICMVGLLLFSLTSFPVLCVCWARVCGFSLLPFVSVSGALSRRPRRSEATTNTTLTNKQQKQRKEKRTQKEKEGNRYSNSRGREWYQKVPAGINILIVRDEHRHCSFKLCAN